MSFGPTVEILMQNVVPPPLRPVLDRASLLISKSIFLKIYTFEILSDFEILLIVNAVNEKKQYNFSHIFEIHTS